MLDRPRSGPGQVRAYFAGPEPEPPRSGSPASGPEPEAQ